MSLLFTRFKWDTSTVWSAAKDQYEYFKNSSIVSGETIINGIDEIASYVDDVKIGDIMYLQWDKDYPHHATIITEIKDGMIGYSAHTNPANGKSLSEFF